MSRTLAFDPTRRADRALLTCLDVANLLDAINVTEARVGLGRRVELTGPDHEFANLARVLNAMLDRICQSACSR